MQSLPVTHDAFFRALLDEPGVAAALLREHLPAEVAALLAPDAPELLDAHFVAAHLRHSQADRLYRARALGGGEVYIYVLLEHKSAPDPEVGVQLLGYLAEIWRRLDRQRLERGGAVGSDRPPIVPLVIYHGAREWAVPLSFGETVAADPALRRYLPDFTYALLDLGQVPDERLSSQRVARGGLRVLKYSYRPDGQGAAVLAAVDDLTGSGFLLSAFLYINWAYDAVDRRAIEGALARAPDEQREAVMSVLAQEREQGDEGELKVKLRVRQRHCSGCLIGASTVFRSPIMLRCWLLTWSSWTPGLTRCLTPRVLMPSLAGQPHTDPTSWPRTLVRQR